MLVYKIEGLDAFITINPEIPLTVSIKKYEPSSTNCEYCNKYLIINDKEYHFMEKSKYTEHIKSGKKDEYTDYIYYTGCNHESKNKFADYNFEELRKLCTESIQKNPIYDLEKISSAITIIYKRRTFRINITLIN